MKSSTYHEYHTDYFFTQNSLCFYLTQNSQNSQIYLILIHNLKEWRCDVRNNALAGLEVLRPATLKTSFQDGQPQNIQRLIASFEPIPFIESVEFSA